MHIANRGWQYAFCLISSVLEMAGSGAQSIAVDECMTLDFVGEIAQEHALGFIGNLHVTGVLFDETEDARANVERCLDDGQQFPGYVFGLGGPIVQHINVARFEEAVRVYHKEKQGKV